MFKFINNIRAHLFDRVTATDDQYILTNFDIPPEGFFTSAELDQLKRIISECISNEESIVEAAKFSAKKWISKSTRTQEMKKSKKRIKLLSNLQRKIKYSLITMG